MRAKLLISIVILAMIGVSITGCIGSSSNATNNRRVTQQQRSKHLQVRPHSQIGNNLCWAAATEMVTDYLRSSSRTAPECSQCKQAALNNNRTGCNESRNPSGGLNAGFDLPGRPFEFGGKTTCPGYSFSTTTHSAVSYNIINTQILSDQPMIGEWVWTGSNGRHFIVVSGFTKSTSDNENMVTVIDPFELLPEPKYITYDSYVESSAEIDTFRPHSHGSDYYNIHPSTSGGN